MARYVCSNCGECVACDRDNFIQLCSVCEEPDCDMTSNPKIVTCLNCQVKTARPNVWDADCPQGWM